MSHPVYPWHEYWDESSGCPYYFNSLDKSSQWERPVDRYGSPLPYLPYSQMPQHYPVEDDIESGMRKDRYEGQSSLSSEGQQAIRRRDERTIVDRSEDNIDDDCGPTKHDYLNMARTYKLEAVYREKRSEVRCVLCFANLCSDVFFPCEHMCVCSACIRKEHISSESDLIKEEGFCHCPLCNQVIKLILPFEQGREVERYWEWVYQVAPPLPKGFLRGFRHSAAVIHKVYIDDRGENTGDFVRPNRGRGEPSGSCSIS